MKPVKLKILKFYFLAQKWSKLFEIFIAFVVFITYPNNVQTFLLFWTIFGGGITKQIINKNNGVKTSINKQIFKMF